jgi:hypothetical protein
MIETILMWIMIILSISFAIYIIPIIISMVFSITVMLLNLIWQAAIIVVPIGLVFAVLGFAEDILF